MSTKPSFFNGKNKQQTSTEELYDGSKPFSPTIPAVNLIPQAVLIKYDKEKLISKIGKTIIAVVGIFALVWSGSFAYATFVKTTNDNIVNEINGLQTQVGEVEPYQKYLDGIELVRQNMAKVSAKNIDMGIVINSIVSSANANSVDIKGLKITESSSTTEQNICISSDAFKTTEQVGCITVTGVSGSQQNVINFFQQVTKTTGLVDSFINSMGTNSDGVVFSGTISISPELYIKRFDYLAFNIDDLLKDGGLSDESIAKILSGDAPSTTDTTNTTTDATTGGETSTATPTPTPTKTP